MTAHTMNELEGLLDEDVRKALDRRAAALGTSVRSTLNTLLRAELVEDGRFEATAEEERLLVERLKEADTARASSAEAVMRRLSSSR